MKVPDKLYHFTSSECAIKILEGSKFKGSKVTNCNDPFEIDQTPFYVDLSNSRHLDYFCSEMLQIYRNHPIFSKNLRCKNN